MHIEDHNIFVCNPSKVWHRVNTQLVEWMTLWTPNFFIYKVMIRLVSTPMGLFWGLNEIKQGKRAIFLHLYQIIALTPPASAPLHHSGQLPKLPAWLCLPSLLLGEGIAPHSLLLLFPLFSPFHPFGKVARIAKGTPTFPIPIPQISAFYHICSKVTILSLPPSLKRQTSK